MPVFLSENEVGIKSDSGFEIFSEKERGHFQRFLGESVAACGAVIFGECQKYVLICLDFCNLDGHLMEVSYEKNPFVGSVALAVCLCRFPNPD